MKLRLMLISVQKVEWTNKETGEEVVKFKHIFLSENNKAYIGWSDHTTNITAVDTNTYDDTRAQIYDCDVDVKGDILRYKVRIP